MRILFFAVVTLRIWLDLFNLESALLRELLFWSAYLNEITAKPAAFFMQSPVCSFLQQTGLLYSLCLASGEEDFFHVDEIVDEEQVGFFSGGDGRSRCAP